MKIHSQTSQFGWDGDRGLGLRLIDAIRSGAKTATCCPASLYSDDEAAEVRGTIGQVVTVIDVEGKPHCNIRILDVFETPWGAPDPRVVRGEGFESIDNWQSALAKAFQGLVDAGTISLTADTPMLVETFELAGDDE